MASIHSDFTRSSASREQQQEILATTDLSERLAAAKQLIEKDLVVATAQVSIREEVGQSVTEGITISSILSVLKKRSKQF